MAYCGPRGLPLSQFLRWSHADQDAALDWQVYEAGRCRGCGTHPDEWAGDRYAFHAHFEQCPGCKEKQRLAEAPEAAERGVFPVVARGPATACPRCRPDDD
jgi:hypothetical protein